MQENSCLQSQRKQIHYYSLSKHGISYISAVSCLLTYFWLPSFHKLIQLGGKKNETKKKQIVFKENKYSLILSLSRLVWKQNQSDSTVLDNTLRAVIPGCPHIPKAHRSGKIDRDNECEGHLYLESQRRSLEEVTFKLYTEENNRVTEVTGEDTNQREGMEVRKQSFPCLKWMRLYPRTMRSPWKCGQHLGSRKDRDLHSPLELPENNADINELL